MELGGQLGLQSRHICQSIQFRSRAPEVYSHPHSTPHKILMGNHRMGHHHIPINLTSQKVSKATDVEIWKQHAKTEVTKIT